MAASSPTVRSSTTLAGFMLRSWAVTQWPNFQPASDGRACASTRRTLVCGFTCTDFVSSNHFIGHFGAGLRYYFRGHCFVRPEADLYLIRNNQDSVLPEPPDSACPWDTRSRLGFDSRRRRNEKGCPILRVLCQGWEAHSQRPELAKGFDFSKADTDPLPAAPTSHPCARTRKDRAPQLSTRNAARIAECRSRTPRRRSLHLSAGLRSAPTTPGSRR